MLKLYFYDILELDCVILTTFKGKKKTHKCKD